jgi:NAD(P)-dependent dehydrogenase (short-subunit alcohol dehydrogenase family)
MLRAAAREMALPERGAKMAETVDAQQQTAIVTGGSRGLGRGIVEALSARGMRVIALARDAAGLESVGRELPAVEPVPGDAADEIIAARLLQERQPSLVVLCAGASALLRPLQLHSWETFSLNWEVDAKSSFVWLRNALLLPMKPGSHIIIVSSMAAVNGSPLSGSYAGAKRMLWFMADYAAQEVSRQKLGVRIHCLLPTLNPSTDLGRAAIAAYAARAGVTIDEFARRLMPHLTPELMGKAVVTLHENPERWDKLAYRVSGDGLIPLDQPSEVKTPANDPKTGKSAAAD